MTKRFGFTLAEVLITLGIIGVVAAMTIPTLMNSTGQAEFKTGFKKIVSTLNQGITMNVALDNSDFSALTSGLGSEAAPSLYSMFNQRMSVMKTATDGGGVTNFSASNYSLFFNDGMAISFPTNCGQTALDGSSATHMCKALVDVNGTKKPNSVSNCANSAVASAEGTTACTAASGANPPIIKDQFSVVLYGQQVLPNGPAAKNVMYK